MNRVYWHSTALVAVLAGTGVVSPTTAQAPLRGAGCPGVLVRVRFGRLTRPGREATNLPRSRNGLSTGRGYNDSGFANL